MWNPTTSKIKPPVDCIEAKVYDIISRVIRVFEFYEKIKLIVSKS